MIDVDAASTNFNDVTAPATHMVVWFSIQTRDCFLFLSALSYMHKILFPELLVHHVLGK